MKLSRLLPIALMLVATPPAATAPRPARLHRAMIVSIDGLRPDCLLRADAPNLRGLMNRGSFTMWAWTTDMATTLPSHVSMLTGVPPSKHGITWNSDRPLRARVDPSRPTLFELAHAAGYTTAMIAGKSKFHGLEKPGTLDWSFVPLLPATSDDVVTDRAVRMIEEHEPQVLFVHLPNVDTAGHDRGWGSDPQLAAIATADRCVGRLLAALEARRLLDSTFVLVSADHGGAGTSHGAGDWRSRFIPWIAAGPGVRRNQDLTTIADLEVRTEDTFATACDLLGLPIPEGTDGRPVVEILEAKVAGVSRARSAAEPAPARPPKARESASGR